MLQFGHGWWTSHWFVCAWLAANAALLVSRVPTLALKAISVPPNAAPILLILVAVARRRAAAVPLHPGAADHRRLPVHHPVHHPQPALGGRAPGDVGRQTRAAPCRPPGATAAPYRRSMARLGLRRPGPAVTQTDRESDETPLTHLRLTARLNTSALDSRRGVVRLHPEAIAALGIREWDAVSLTGCAHHRRGGGRRRRPTSRPAPPCSTTSRCPTPACGRTPR